MHFTRNQSRYFLWYTNRERIQCAILSMDAEGRNQHGARGDESPMVKFFSCTFSIEANFSTTVCSHKAQQEDGWLQLRVHVLVQSCTISEYKVHV